MLGGDELIAFERELGGNRMQASVALELEDVSSHVQGGYFKVQDNSIVLSEEVRSWLQLGGGRGAEAEEGNEGLGEEETENKCAIAIIEGIKGALQRGPNGHEMCNVRCKVLRIESEAGYGDDQAGALRAATSFITQKFLKEGKKGSTITVEVSESGERSDMQRERERGRERE